MSRSGNAPNAMGFALDMGGNAIINAGEITTGSVIINGVEITDVVTVYETVTQNETNITNIQNDLSTTETNVTNIQNVLPSEGDGSVMGKFAGVVIETGSFTLDDSYSGKIIYVDSESQADVLIDPASSVGLQCMVVQAGAGVVQFTNDGIGDSFLAVNGDAIDNSSGPGGVATVVRFRENAAGGDTIYLNGQMV